MTMTWTYDEEFYKKYTRDTWNESASEYEPVMRNLDRYTPDLLAAVEPKRGERVLDVATGPGEPALTIARAIAPGGRVVGIDLAERMIELARSNAKAATLEETASFETMDAESLTFPDATFDVAVSRFGMQIVTNPEKALAEMHRVLRPGGRVGLTVWGPRERCPALDVIIGPMLEHAEPDETGYLPTPYEMGGIDEMAGILRAQGFHDVRETRVVRDWEWPSVDAYFHGTLKGTPIGHSVGEEDEDVQRSVLEKTRANLEKFVATDGSVRLPAECVVASGVR